MRSAAQRFGALFFLLAFCEWYQNGDCYVEFASGGCFVQGGFPGWWAAVF